MRRFTTFRPCSAGCFSGAKIPWKRTVGSGCATCQNRNRPFFSSTSGPDGSAATSASATGRAPPMVRPLPLLRRPAERHDPHDESAGSGARPAFSAAQGAAPLQVRLRRTRTHPPCTRRRDLLFRKRLALTAGLPHIERRRVQRLHSCPRNRPTGDVRLLGAGAGRPTIGTRRRYAPLPDYPDAERRSLVEPPPVWRRLGTDQRSLRFDATGFCPALESHDERSATHPFRDVRQRKTRTYRTAERWPRGADHASF